MTRGSLPARLLCRLLRRFVKPRSRFRPDVPASRAMMERVVLSPGLLGVRVWPGRVGGIPGEWLAPRRGASPATVLYLHGGAFCVCSPAVLRPITGALARRGFRVFAPAYRLAPEHPFPAALDDAASAYRGLLAEGQDPARLFVAGDSAGGGLALSLLLRLKRDGLPRPAAAALFSPWADLSLSGESLRANATRDPVFHPDHAGWVAGLYAGPLDRRTPELSPVFGDLSGLPPLLIQAGESELLLDDARRVAASAAGAGVPVLLTVWPDVPHGWQAVTPLPEARRALNEAAAFFRRPAAPAP